LLQVQTVYRKMSVITAEIFLREVSKYDHNIGELNICAGHWSPIFYILKSVTVKGAVISEVSLNVFKWMIHFYVFRI
jgi:hypothetical protein